MKRNKDIAVITGDVMRSRSRATKTWLEPLKTVLRSYGAEPKDWEIFRGDSFQLVLKPEQALEAAILLKATMKMKKLDIRMAIGIGPRAYNAAKITQSNGEAFVKSGSTFETLKGHALQVNTGNETVDNEINLYLELLLLTISSWSPVAAEVVKTALENPKLTQNQLAQKMVRSQSNISAALRRAGFEELKKVLKRYIELVNLK